MKIKRYRLCLCKPLYIYDKWGNRNTRTKSNWLLAGFYTLRPNTNVMFIRTYQSYIVRCSPECKMWGAIFTPRYCLPTLYPCGLQLTLKFEIVLLSNSSMTYMLLSKMCKNKPFGVPLRYAGFMEFVRSQKSGWGATHNQSTLGQLNTVRVCKFYTDLFEVHLLFMK